MAEKKKFLSLQQIKESKDEKFAEIDVPEWGGTIRIGSITAGEMIDFAESNDGPAKKTAGLRLIVKSLVDEDGNRIGDDALLQDLKKKDSAVCSRITDAILELNGLGEEAKKKRKNASGEATTAASPTA